MTSSFSTIPVPAQTPSSIPSTSLDSEINESTRQYISHLSEPQQTYIRFFDALLIPRPNHPQFLGDLKSFRQQPHIITLISCARSDKTLWRSVTDEFMASQFAEEWASKLSPSARGAVTDAGREREEARLHKLLVPIWVIMGTKMFPGDEVVERFCNGERQQRGVAKGGSESEMAGVQLGVVAQSQVSGQSMKSHAPRDKPLYGWDSDEEGDEDGEDGEDVSGERGAGHAATTVFRLAAAGVILSQTPKRKLRWLRRKPK